MSGAAVSLLPGGNLVSLNDGQKATYRYTFQAAAPYATPTDWIVIRGANGVVVRITHLEISGAATAATEVIFAFKKHTIADTVGTSTNPTPVPHDSGDGAAQATVFLYTVAPTIDASAVIFEPVRLTLAVAPAATSVNPDRFVADYGARPSKAPTLRGVAQEFALNFGGAAVPAGGVYDGVIEWTESTT